MNSPMGAWEKLANTLDNDMMLIYPEMYVENQDMFDEIIGIGYLIKDLRHPEDSIDWVTERQLWKLLSKSTTIAVISKLLIVRLRLPWYNVKHEWLCSRAEVEKNSDEYEILDSYIWARHNGGKAHWINPSERQYFDEHRKEYEIVDIKYNVRWKWTEDDIDDLTASPFVDDNCIAHVYAEDIEFWDKHFNRGRK